ncbi:MAG: FABP family protein [Actinomycetia bacterium]|nr:FABP family protein [Actinomycetes bacterium]
MATPELHPDCEQLAGLLGTWRGGGEGEYPTVESFDYVEEVKFAHVGKPFLAYDQRTRATDDGRPLHAETGYWRPVVPGHLEVVLSHPTGVAEVLEGSIVTGPTIVIDLHTTSVSLTSTAKSVSQLHRRFELDGDVLRYRLAMAAVGVPLTHHLTGELRRVV